MHRWAEGFAAPQWVLRGIVSVVVGLACASIAIAQFGEIGHNDMRLSEAGGTGDPSVIPRAPRVAYAPSSNTFLVVWLESNNNLGDRRIRAQRYDAVTGKPVGQLAGLNPPNLVNGYSVAYNNTADQFIVAFSADEFDAGQLEGEFEIFVFNIDPGSSQSFFDARISAAGGIGESVADARSPEIVCSSLNSECLVVWEADPGDGALGDDEFEIFGQRVDASNGDELGVDDFRISDMGGTGDATWSGISPDIDYNAVTNQYLVVWQGEDNLGGLVENEVEIFGQILGSDGASIPPNDFRISFAGGTGNANFDAFSPRVEHNSPHNEYLVIWSGSDNTGGLVEGEGEIFGQFVDDVGTLIGTPGLRISDAGDTGDTSFDAGRPKLVYLVGRDDFLVTWQADDNVGFLVDGDFEIFGQRIDASTGQETGPNDFRVSDMGPDGDTFFGAEDVAVAYNTLSDRALIVWKANDDNFELDPFELEVFGQFLGEQTVFIDGFESGNTASWSAVSP